LVLDRVLAVVRVVVGMGKAQFSSLRTRTGWVSRVVLKALKSCWIWLSLA